MSFIYPKITERAFSGQFDWTTANLRLALLMSNEIASTSPAIEFVGDLTGAELDEYDGAGYARTALTALALELVVPSVPVTPPTAILRLKAAQTDTPSISAGTRLCTVGLLLEHVGADSVNPVVAILDDPPWFPFQGQGRPAKFAWDAVKGVLELRLGL